MFCNQPVVRWSDGHRFALVAPLLTSGLAVLAVPAFGQTVVPSQVLPRETSPARPAPLADGVATTNEVNGETDDKPVWGQSFDAGEARIGGAFPEMETANRAFLGEIAHKRVTLRQLMAATRSLERKYAARGYIFARAILPPQRLADGEKVEILIVDGYVEEVDLAHVPRSLQPLLRRRFAHLIGRRHLTEAKLERALLLASEIAGVSLRSAIATGLKPGGVRLVIEGQLERVQLHVGTDNRLPGSLGQWQWNGNLVVNNGLGLGEQTYLFAGSQFDIARHGIGRPTLGLLGGGISVPITRTGIVFGSEVLIARTEPVRVAGVPRTVGAFARGQFAVTAALSRTRRGSIDIRIGADLISQSARAPEFAATLNRDRYAALRIGMTWREQAGRAARSLNLSFSQGLLGRTATRLVPFSRLGAANAFNSLQANARWSGGLPRGFGYDIQMKAQTSFGKPLFLSEQFALDGPAAVSSFESGSFNVDSGATMRAELILPSLAAKRSMSFSPYAYAAGGVGRIEQATAVERPILNAAGIGIGGRINLAALPGLHRSSASIGIEAGRQFSNISGKRGGNRVNVTAYFAF